MKSWISLIVLSIFTILMISCGSDPVADGDKAFSEGNYNPALNYYMQAKKAQPDNILIDEKIAITYMKKGMRLYKRTRNIEAFTGNFEKGEKFIPENASPDFEKQYSNMLFELANAYHKAKPSNEIQKEQYFSKTLDNLERSLTLDSANSSSDSLLNAIKQQNFQRMFDKGVEFYKRAKKEKTNEELYLTAESYLKRAVFFNEESEDAKKYLKTIRQKTLRILDTEQDFPLAIAGIKRVGASLLYDITGFNNIGKAMEFKPINLTLTDSNGDVHTFDSEETAKYESGLAEAKSLKAREQIDGIVAFKISKSIKPVLLSYEDEGILASKKFLP